MKYRKKPVVIEAVKMDPEQSRNDPEAARWTWLAQWVESLGGDASEWVFAPDGVEIPTLEGVMRADVGDYVIRGVKGEFYPCKPDIFEQTYEAVD